VSPRGIASSFIGFVVGGVVGVLGVIVTRLNEQTFGAMHSRYRGEWLAIPALPGELIAEWRFGSDWQFGEWWPQRYEIIGWNALLWGIAWLVVAVFCKVRRQLTRAGSV
jgi:hypothetical protein